VEQIKKDYEAKLSESHRAREDSHKELQHKHEKMKSELQDKHHNLEKTHTHVNELIRLFCQINDTKKEIVHCFRSMQGKNLE
jgi:hypothetical protein